MSRLLFNKCGWFFLSFAILSTSLVAATFRAYVDPNTVAVGESLTLFLEYSGNAQQEPDLTGALEDFSILSRSQATNMMNINGRSETKTIFSYTIKPKTNKEGALYIRPITYQGETSSPVTVRVSGRTEPAQGIEVKAIVGKPSVYINEAIPLSVTLLARVNIGQIGLKPPTIKNGIIEPIGDGVALEAIENGVKVVSYEQKFLIFVDKEGPTTIGSATFEGVISRGGRSFTGFPLRERFQESTDEIKVVVKPKPSTFPANHPFIAVENLAVVENFLSQGPYETNKAITRKFEIRGKNTLASFLPALSLPQVDGLKIYSEPGNKNEHAEDGNLIATLETAHVYMPTKKGTVQIPEQVIYWWNTVTDKLMTTSIRAVELPVEGSDASLPEASPNNNDENIHHNVDTQKESPKTFNVWSLLAGMFFALWIATVIFFWLVYRRVNHKKSTPTLPTTPRASDHLSMLKKALTEQNNDAAYKALTDLKFCAQTESIRALNEAFLDESSSISKAYRTLSEAKYGANPSPIDYKKLEPLPVEIKKLIDHEDIRKNMLPDVYPRT